MISTPSLLVGCFLIVASVLVLALLRWDGRSQEIRDRLDELDNLHLILTGERIPPDERKRMKELLRAKSAHQQRP